MRKELHQKHYSFFAILVFFLFSQIAFAQLPAFTLNVTKTDESCTANGTLSFTATNTAVGATVVYQIYRLPDVVNTIAETNANSFGGLTAGTYKVLATQYLGNLSSAQQQTVTLLNTIVPLIYDIIGQPIVCGALGSITVHATQGNPVAYEIISGPVIVPLQSSPILAGLPIGEYDVRVIDNCGEGVVQTYRLLEEESTLYLGIVYDDSGSCTNLTSCNTVLANFTITPPLLSTIVYPILVEITVFPPDGGTPFVASQTITSGSPLHLNVGFDIPFYDVDSYFVTIKVTDQCGNIARTENIPIPNVRFTGIEGQYPRSCLNEINIAACGFLPPFMVEFLDAPAGFDPTSHNPLHPGPMTFMNYTSTLDNQIPEGDYLIKVTDQCGFVLQEVFTVKHSKTRYLRFPGYDGCEFNTQVEIGPAVLPVTVIITEAPPAFNHELPYDVSFNISDKNGVFYMTFNVPGMYTLTGVNVCGEVYTFEIEIPESDLHLEYDTELSYNGCANNGNSIFVFLKDNVVENRPPSPQLATVFIIQAPPNFGQPLPYDVSSSINEETHYSALIEDLVPGGYMIQVTDECGRVYTELIKIYPTPPPAPVVRKLNGCDIGMGSVAINCGFDSDLVSVIMQTAPADYLHEMPYDVSFNIDFVGGFSMNTLPAGTYTFFTRDECGNEAISEVTIIGLEIELDLFSLNGNCGSFDVSIYHRTNDTFQLAVWLQKYNPATQQWGHPYTGAVYSPGSIPNASNSLLLQNFSTNFNIAALGRFRIMRSNLIFPNASSYNFFTCREVIREFEYTGELKITNANTIPCSNGSFGVYVEAEGVAPLTYSITSKDGQPFFIDNGTSNTFSGLQSGIYNFQVRDWCGNIVNRLFDITTLSEPAVTAYNLCEGQNGNLSVVAFSFFNYQWWKADNPNLILSNTNTLAFTPFSNTLTPGTYHVRIYSTSGLTCIDRVLTYVLTAPLLPNAGFDAQRTFCGAVENFDLFTLLGPPYDLNGSWNQTSAGGVLNQNIWSSSGISNGDYSFNYVVRDLCGNTDLATVQLHLKEIPPNPIVQVNPGFCNLDGISFQVDSIPNATYIWTGPNGFSSQEQNPSIENSTALNSGEYIVKATVDGCESTSTVDVALLPSPEYIMEPSCVSGQYTITVKPSNGSFEAQTATYSWTGPDNYTNNQNPIQITDLPTGFYEVTVTNADGCETHQALQVTGTKCIIPNVISANNDLTNDSFNLSGLNVKRLEVYSRWGRLVYDQNNYTDQWHGQNNKNQPLPDSTYYYIAYMLSGEEKQGWVFVTSR